MKKRGKDGESLPRLRYFALANIILSLPMRSLKGSRIGYIQAVWEFC